MFTCATHKTPLERIPWQVSLVTPLAKFDKLLCRSCEREKMFGSGVQVIQHPTS